VLLLDPTDKYEASSFALLLRCPCTGALSPLQGGREARASEDEMDVALNLEFNAAPSSEKLLEILCSGTHFE
jgi:hypothetical protein